MSYRALLTDPQWQAKRLEVIKRANGVCERCGTDKRLTVHHGYYEPYMMPWEYRSETLHCLCRPCHMEVQVLMGFIHEVIAQCNPCELRRLLQRIENIVVNDGYMRRNQRELVSSADDFEESVNGVQVAQQKGMEGTPVSDRA